MFDEVQPAVGPYLRAAADCTPWDPLAGEAARALADLIRSHLPDARVEHVGSTAVYQCDGRGIIDLMIPVAPLADGPVEALLERLGFQRQSDLFPESQPGYAGCFAHRGRTFQVHVCVLPESAPEAEQMRFLRACLRSDGELLRAYVAKKREIVRQGATDPIAYTRHKGEFLKQILG